MMNKVQVYRNLNKKCWSIRSNGLVVEHLDELVLLDILFKVSAAGRQRVIKERRKNVHAYAEGMLIKKHIDSFWKEVCVDKVTYNPYLRGSFYNPATNEDIESAEIATFNKDGSVSMGQICFLE